MTARSSRAPGAHRPHDRGVVTAVVHRDPGADRRRRLTVLLLVVALVTAVSCSSGGDREEARPPATDPMCAVSDAARFT